MAAASPARNLSLEKLIILGGLLGSHFCYSKSLNDSPTIRTYSPIPPPPLLPPAHTPPKMRPKFIPS